GTELRERTGFHVDVSGYAFHFQHTADAARADVARNRLELGTLRLAAEVDFAADTVDADLACVADDAQFAAHGFRIEPRSGRARHRHVGAHRVDVQFRAARYLDVEDGIAHAVRRAPVEPAFVAGRFDLDAQVIAA